MSPIPLGILASSGASAYPISYLVIAGGGAGGSGIGPASGGGGAGGYRTSVAGQLSGQNSPAESILQFPKGTVLTLTIGAGGAPYSSGANSVFGPITSIGGGVGGFRGEGAVGGSGGGGGPVPGDGPRAGGAGTANQGFAGGIGVNDLTNGGGGGGAGQLGGDASPGLGGPPGGAGIFSNITGTSIQRGGGGGGGGYRHGGAGGAGGGGNGGGDSPGDPTPYPGVVNTGGGGGGKRATFFNDGAPGGSGVVIISFPSNFPALTSISGGLTSTNSIVGSNRVYVFTAGTGTITI